MDGQYDGRLLFKNIDYLIKQQKRKIGEVETEAGVSAGYISRTSREGGSKPGIDFLMGVAKVLGVSLDTLLTVDLSALTSTDAYLLSFLTKLNDDTARDLLIWDREFAVNLNELTYDENGYVAHPLFQLGVPWELADGSKDLDVKFCSNSFCLNTTINGDCYNIRLKNGARLYVMNIEQAFAPSGENPHDTAKEIWITMDGHEPKFLCSDWRGAHLASMVDTLYTTIQESFRRPQIGQDYRYIIDAFMKGDMKDDTSTFGPKDDDMPF